MLRFLLRRDARLAMLYVQVFATAFLAETRLTLVVELIGSTGGEDMAMDISAETGRHV